MADSKEKNATSVKGLNYIGLAVDFGLSIALPLVAMIYVGKWLNGRYNVEYFIPFAIIVALVITSALIYRKIKHITDSFKQ